MIDKNYKPWLIEINTNPRPLAYQLEKIPEEVLLDYCKYIVPKTKENLNFLKGVEEKPKQKRNKAKPKPGKYDTLNKAIPVIIDLVL